MAQTYPDQDMIDPDQGGIGEMTQTDPDQDGISEMKRTDPD